MATAANTIFSLLSILLFTKINGDHQYEYGMVIDAGSTHSALYIYKFSDRITSTNVPPQSSPNQIAASNSTDPVGELVSQQQCDTLIKTLTQFAKHTLVDDKDRWDRFPIYLKATAGMRILENDDRERILGYLSNSFSNISINPFLFDATYAIVASGEEEATFDWLGVNYIWETLHNTNADHMTYGALDLGGRSTQMAFAAQPNSNILSEFTAVRLWETTHRLYSHSFLEYGTDGIEERVAQLAYDETASDAKKTYNPCLNNGINITYTVSANGNEIDVMQYGNSKDNRYGCTAMIRKLIANDTDCYVKDCSFNGVYQAEIPSNMTFIAFSAFSYVIDGLGLSEDIDLWELYNDVALDICNMTFSELQASKYNMPSSQTFLNTYCRACTYIYTLLHEGYGFSVNNTPIIFTNKHNDVSISWTQGSILRDANWLPYELVYNVKTSDSLNSEGKMWRTMSITLCTILVVVLFGCVYVIWKLKKMGNSTEYQNSLINS